MNASRQYLERVGKMCTHIAHSPDDREVRAALRTLSDMPALLQRNGLAPTGFPEAGCEPFHLSDEELGLAWGEGKA